jgi:hypothetical protein
MYVNLTMMRDYENPFIYTTHLGNSGCVSSAHLRCTEESFEIRLGMWR